MNTKLYVVIILLISLGLNSVANAGTWMCFTPECNIGNIKDNKQSNTNQDQYTQKRRTTNIWNPDGSRKIISEDPSTGRTDIWHEDGSLTIITTEEK
jgi:hypothetical protein